MTTTQQMKCRFCNADPFRYMDRPGEPLNEAADLAEALDVLATVLRDACDYNRGYTIAVAPNAGKAARLLAKHGRFKITRDDAWTEGVWL